MCDMPYLYFFSKILLFSKTHTAHSPNLQKTPQPSLRFPVIRQKRLQKSKKRPCKTLENPIFFQGFRSSFLRQSSPKTPFLVHNPEPFSNKSRTKLEQNPSKHLSRSLTTKPTATMSQIKSNVSRGFRTIPKLLPLHLPTHRETGVMLNEVKHLLRLRPCLQRLLKTHRDNIFNPKTNGILF